MYIFVLIANFAAIYFFTSATYAFIGVPYTLCAIIVSIIGYNSSFANWMINRQIKTWNDKLDKQGDIGKKILVSIAFLIFGIKIFIFLGLLITFLGIGLLALAFYIACQSIMRGSFLYKILQSIGLAQIVIKIYQFITSLLEKIIFALIRLEFKILGIEILE